MAVAPALLHGSRSGCSRGLGARRLQEQLFDDFEYLELVLNAFERFRIVLDVVMPCVPNFRPLSRMTTSCPILDEEGPPMAGYRFLLQGGEDRVLGCRKRLSQARLCWVVECAVFCFISDGATHKWISSCKQHGRTTSLLRCV